MLHVVIAYALLFSHSVVSDFFATPWDEQGSSLKRVDRGIGEGCQVSWESRAEAQACSDQAYI